MKENAIEYFKFHRKIFCDDYLKICPKDSIAYQATLKEKEFYDMAIKALEQDSILDKIKAEIIKYEGDCRLSVDEYPSCEQCTNSVFGTIYGILDKYKAESEE